MNYELRNSQAISFFRLRCQIKLFKSLIVLASLIFSPTVLLASEGGSSGYLQGTYGEFASGMLGPQGFYMRNDLFYYDAEVGIRPLGGAINIGAEQQVTGDLLKFAYVSDLTFLGGKYNAALAIPVIFNGSASGSLSTPVPGFGTYRSGDVSGVGDIYLTPAALGWDWGNHHLNANLSFVIPTGSYDASKLLNTGRNYWSFDPTVYYTWLQPQRGHEVTVSLGYMINEENSDTNYTTGDELHIDWTLAQHFSESFALGLVGYFYEQVTNDEGQLPAGFDAKDFKGSGAGVGISALYARPLLGKDMNFIAKWVTDTNSKNRMEGDIFMLSFAFKF